MSFESLTRNVHAILSFYNEKSELVDISRAVSSINLKEITCSDDTLKMGEFCKNCLEFEYYQEFVDENIAWNNKRVKLSFTEGNTEEEKAKNTVDVGIFYVQAKDVETSNNGKSYKVTCYDLPSVMSETFDTTKTSSSVTDIVKYIGSISGMYFTDETTFGLDKIESIDEELTNIGMLAYIVGYDGKNIRTTTDGKLETYWYYSNTDSSHFKETISRDVQLLNEFTNKEVVSPLNAITSGYTISEDDSSTVISVGSGVAMTYTNPYITKEQLQSVLDRVKGFNYSVGSVKFRGNPSYRCGDTVQVETTQGEYVLFPIMEQTITYDGGMVATISSYTYETENTVMGSGGSVDKKISQVYSGLTASFQKQTGLINTNLKGGYYRLLQDTDTKYPYGWLIADSEEITDSTKGWRFTQGGLMYSEDGFKTASGIAMTMDGQISADFITVGTMSVERLAIMGSGSETMKITSDSQGALFDGSGWFKVNAVGGFNLINYKDSAKTQYRNRLCTYLSDTSQEMQINNYQKDGTSNKKANEFWERSSSTDSFIGLNNFDPDSPNSEVVDNFIYLRSYKDSSNGGQKGIYIQNQKDGVKRNWLSLRSSTSTDSNNYLYIENAKSDGNTANRLSMQSDTSSDARSITLVNMQDGTYTANMLRLIYSSSLRRIGMYQYDSSHNQIGNINITNNEAQIGSGDACYFHFNTDGYIYGKSGNTGAYRLGWVTINGKTVLGVV
jgi:hypothetical protein